MALLAMKICRLAGLLTAASMASADFLAKAPLAAAPAPATAGLPGVLVNFEMGNINYDDLEKGVVPPPDVFSRELPYEASSITGPTEPSSSNTLSGVRQFTEAVEDAHYASSRATRDTVQKISSHVHEKLKDGSVVVSEGVKEGAAATHDGLEVAADGVHEATTDTAHAMHRGVHGEDAVEEAEQGLSPIITVGSFLRVFPSIPKRDGTESFLVGDIMEAAIKEAVVEEIHSRMNASTSIPAHAAPAIAAGPSLAPVNAPSPAAAAMSPAPGPKFGVFVHFKPGKPKAVIEDRLAWPSHRQGFLHDAERDLHDVERETTQGLADASADASALEKEAAEMVPVGSFGLSGAGKAIPVSDNIWPHPPIERAPPAPGKKILRHINPHGRTTGRTTRVEVTITDTSGDGVDHLPGVQQLLKQAEDAGTLQKRVANKVQIAAGVQPKFVSFGLGPTQIAQWSLAVCKTHMAQVVRRFEVAYTRRMVPTAIFNECTNFMSASSFSHDDVPTDLDVKRCKAATIRFARQWNLGKGPRGQVSPPAGLALIDNAPKKAPVDMTGFCVDVCEHKFGLDAPWCHVTEGDNNLAKGH